MERHVVVRRLRGAEREDHAVAGALRKGLTTARVLGFRDLRREGRNAQEQRAHERESTGHRRISEEGSPLRDRPRNLLSTTERDRKLDFVPCADEARASPNGV